MQDWPAHPASRVFPELPESEYRALVNDIKLHGLREPITLWKDADGLVYLADGRHRMRACKELGIKPTTLYWQGDDVVSHIVSANVLRRHLEPRDRISLALRAVQADKEFLERRQSRLRVRNGHKKLGIVSRVAKLARVAKPTAYEHLRTIAPGCFRPQVNLKPQIEALMRDPSKLPPDPVRTHGAGKKRTLERRIAEYLNVTLSTVRRHLSNSNFNNFSAASIKPPTVVPEPKPKDDLTPEDLALARAVRTLEDVSGQDLTPWGLRQLDAATKHIRRIDAEYKSTITVPAPAAVSQPAHA